MVQMVLYNKYTKTDNTYIYYILKEGGAEQMRKRNKQKRNKKQFTYCLLVFIAYVLMFILFLIKANIFIIK